MRKLDWSKVEGIDKEEAERLNGPEFVRCPTTGFSCFGRDCKQASKEWAGAEFQRDGGVTHVTCDHYVWTCEEVTGPVDRTSETPMSPTESMSELAARLAFINSYLFGAVLQLTDGGAPKLGTMRGGYDQVCEANKLLVDLIKEIERDKVS